MLLVKLLVKLLQLLTLVISSMSRPVSSGDRAREEARAPMLGCEVVPAMASIAASTASAPAWSVLGFCRRGRREGKQERRRHETDEI